MNRYYDELEAYEDDAEGRYDNYDEFDPGFEGNEDEYYDDEYPDEEMEYIPEMDAEYDDYRKTSIGRIDPNDRTLTIVVRNEGDNDATAIIFGANEAASQPAGVTVRVEESSHQEVREESKANPFKIVGMKMSSSDPLQFDNVLKIIRRTATGSNSERVYQPRNATSPQNFSQGLIDDHNFELDVTGQDSIRFTVKSGASIVFTMTIKARANMGNLLKGSNVAELSTQPRTTGLPQLDLVRTKSPSAFGIKPRRPARRPVRRRRPRTSLGAMKYLRRRR